MWAFL